MPAEGTSSPEDHKKSSAPHLMGLLQPAAEFLDPEGRSRSNCISECEAYTNNSLILTGCNCSLCFRDATKFSFLSCLALNTRPESLPEFRHCRAPLDHFFQMPIVTKKAWWWLVATSNSKPIKDAGMTRMPKTMMPQNKYMSKGLS